MNTLNKLTDEVIQRGNIEEIMCAAHGVDKIKISIPNTNDEDIEVGKIFYHYNADIHKIEKLTITYIRSGVVFYVTDQQPDIEDYFPLGCLMHYHLEPEIYESNYDSMYYEVVSRLGKTKIIYKNSYE